MRLWIYNRTSQLFGIESSLPFYESLAIIIKQHRQHSKNQFINLKMPVFTLHWTRAIEQWTESSLLTRENTKRCAVMRDVEHLIKQAAANGKLFDVSFVWFLIRLICVVDDVVRYRILCDVIATSIFCYRLMFCCCHFYLHLRFVFALSYIWLCFFFIFVACLTRDFRKYPPKVSSSSFVCFI